MKEIDTQIQAQMDRIHAASLKKLAALNDIENADAELAEGRAIIAGLQFARTLIATDVGSESANTIDAEKPTKGADDHSQTT